MRSTPYLRVISALLCMTFFTSLMAQKSSIDYDLSKYQLPYLKRHTLETDFYFSGSQAGYNQESQSIADGWRSDSRSRNLNLDGRLIPKYSLYLNTEKLQLSQNLSGGFTLFDFDRNSYTRNSSGRSLDPGNGNIKEFNHHSGINYSGTFREFLKGKFFLEQNLILNYQYYTTSRTSETLDSAENPVDNEFNLRKRHSMEPNLEFLAGWGRIERVEDARMAVYILDDLNRAGVLAKNVEQEDIQALAEVVSYLQNERFFDARHKKIWELRQLDSTLQSLGLIEEEGMVYYTLLQDNWTYAALPIRQSGFQIAGGVSSDNRFDLSNSEEEYTRFIDDSIFSRGAEMYSQNIDLGGVIRLRYEKPLNLYWQLSVTENLRIHKENYLGIQNLSDMDLESRNESHNLIYNNNLDVSLGYYPNSRTSVAFSFTSNLEFTDIVPDVSPRDKVLINYQSLGTTINYYFSPRLRLQMSGTLTNRNSKAFAVSGSDYESFSNNFDGYFNAGLVYKFL